MPTVPLSGTNIRLLSGVPFSNDYKHTRWFDSLSLQTTYFTSKTIVHSMSESSFQRIEGKNFIAVNKSIDELWTTNYLMFQNAQYNNQWFYAFVTKLEYVQRNTTYVHFEIDVFQTWKFIMNFKPSYVAREHCKLWNVDGSPVINTVDEGLDYGKEYDVAGAEFYNTFGGVKFLVIVAKSTLHPIDGYPPHDGNPANYIISSMNGMAQPLSIYFHPFDIYGQSPNISIDSVGAGISSINTVLDKIYSQITAVNNIVSMYITDHVGLDFEYNDFGDPTLVFTSSATQGIEIVEIGDSIKTIYVQAAYNYTPSSIMCNDKYTYLGGNTESKLLMYPYSLALLTDFKGNQVTLKNEYIKGNSLEIDIMGSMGVANKVAYIPKNYLTDYLIPTQQTIVGLQNALIDNSSHDVSIITDMLAAFIQGNKNSLENQKNSIVFNGVTDAIGATIGGIASGLTGNAMGVASAVTGGIKGAGNSVLQLQGMQAKQKDIGNQPPQMVKMGGNTSFDYGNGYYGVWVISKQIKPEYQKKLSDFFNMYGYKLNEVKIPNFHTRQCWNYVQTISCNIIANINNEDLQELKTIFDNGITLWHTDDVGNYMLSNGVI